MRPEALKGHLDSLLLAVIAERPAHGYEIANELRRRSDGVFDLPEGTIYPALHRLERGGWLSSRWSTSSGRRRRVYRLTRRGRTALARSRSDWKAFSGAIDAVLT
jgi:PadR family transcriptional regulator PadR